ncbi:MAG: methyltransferase domain-containing protein [Firmicutes bacterium]|nr:methyltransferase domain-containing protein [Bacillota bacterium]
MIHKMFLNPESFRKIKDGTKKVELRLFDEKRKQVKIGDTIIFTNRESQEQLLVTVKDLHFFSSFRKLFKKIENTKLGCVEADLDEFYTEAEQHKYGVVGIEIAEYVDERNVFKETWERIHAIHMNTAVVYDDWLDKYLHMIPKDDVILELGCGRGNNVKYLLERGFDILATDFSENAINYVSKKFPKSKTMLLDVNNTFPFKNAQFSVIIADLCLHYFTQQKTEEILKEIKRVLRPNGILLARVNSKNDIEYGAGKGKKIEKDYYFVEGYNKRFFDIASAQRFFEIVGQTKVTETDISRYDKVKKAIEISVRKF